MKSYERLIIGSVSVLGKSSVPHVTAVECYGISGVCMEISHDIVRSHDYLFSSAKEFFLQYHY